MRPGCCARTAIGHIAAAPPTSVMKSRRLMPIPRLSSWHRSGSNECFDRGRNPLRYCNMIGGPDVRVGSWSCRNSNARRTRRNILEKLRVMRTDDSADMGFDAVLENCIFYIFPTYEFLHSLGQTQTSKNHLFSARKCHEPIPIGHFHLSQCLGIHSVGVCNDSIEVQDISDDRINLIVGQ